MEIRIKDVELHAEDDSALKVGGYINVVETESEMLFSKKRGKWFKEIMKRGVFKKAIEKAKEIPLLFEHDWGKQLATTKDNSLTLKEDSVGLKFEAEIRDKSIYEKIKSGVVRSCSFGFKALSETIEDVDSRLEKRLVDSIELVEVSLVQSPAYASSLVETRNYEEELKKEKEEETDKKTKEEKSEKENSTSEKDENKSKEDSKEDDKSKEKSEDEEDSKEDSKDEDESKKSDERSMGEITSDSEEEVVETQISKDEIKNIVDDLINKKFEEIKNAEEKEADLNEELQSAKDFHKKIESEIAHNCMKQNVEVMKMRLDLIKLNLLKKGI